MVTKRLRTWIVVADGARARFFTASDDGGKLVAAAAADMVAPMNRRPASALKSDKPGRGYSSARSGMRHALEPPHDYHKLEKHRFCAELAQALDTASAAKQFERLVLVAPRRSLGELRGLLSTQVKRQVGLEIAKDLTNLPPSRLWRQLQTLISPAAAPVAPTRRRAA